MELRRVDRENVWPLLKLQVRPEQQHFVATNTESIVEAYTTVAAGGIALPFGLYDGETPVGFTMLSFDCADWEDAPAIAAGNYCIWRLMIDKQYQHRGFGKQAMVEILRYIGTMPCGKSDTVWLSYEPDNTAARDFYRSFGFRDTGETDGEEIIAVRPIFL